VGHDANVARRAGFERIGASLDSLIGGIARAGRAESQLFAEVADRFRFPEAFFRKQVGSWVESQERLADGDPANLSEVAFSSTAQQLGVLEDSLAALVSALEWGQQHPGFIWWLRRRQEELGVGGVQVIPAPGSSCRFEIENESGVRTKLESLRRVGVLQDLTKAQLEGVSKVRLIYAPAFDGLSFAWHPLTLGHELAHMKFPARSIAQWLARLEQKERWAPSTRKMVAELAELQETKAERVLSELPSAKLVQWLAETACDLTLKRYYGDGGVEALLEVLETRSIQADTITHPGPDRRKAALEDAEPSPVTHRVTEEEDVVTAYRDLLVDCRAMVARRLSGVAFHQEEFDTTLDAARHALSKQHTPLSETWAPATLAVAPSTIESALVAAFWSEAVSPSSSEMNPNDAANVRMMQGLVGHAMDVLQLCHRFELKRSLVPTAAGHPLISNLYWIDHRGINTVDPIELPESSEGASSKDVRLGRHFVTFRRNRLSSLRSLDDLRDVDAIAEAHEVDWDGTFQLHPGELVLGVTLEGIDVATDSTVQILSRSSLGRLGLLVATAVHVQPGYRGCLTLELVNLSSVPLELVPGQRVAQLVPARALGKRLAYAGQYQDVYWKPKFSGASNDWDAGVLRLMRAAGTERRRGLPDG